MTAKNPTFTKKPCTFYQANACTKGETCPYSHIGQQAAPRSICAHFKSGSCLFGDRCRDIHATPAQTECATPSESQIACKFWQSGRCTKGERCKFLHETSPQEGTTTSGSSSWRDKDLSIRPPVKFGKELDNGDNSRQQPSITVQQLDLSRDMQQLGLQPVGGDSALIDADETPHQEEARQTLQRGFGQTVVTFSAGAQIDELQTAFESRCVVISNVEPETSFEEMLAFVEKYDDSQAKSLVLKPFPNSGALQKVEVEYATVQAAAATLRAIDGEAFRGRTLVAQFHGKLSSQTDTADLRSSTLKLSWFAPSRIAYASYRSVFVATRKASALHGKEFGGRKILATLQPPSFFNQRSFTVVIKGLPFDYDSKALEIFCGASAISPGRATYQAEEGTEHIRKLLENIGPLESFDDSQPKPNDVKVKALIRFVKAEHAYAALKQINGQSYEFLGGGKIFVNLLHSLKYYVPRAQFKVLEAAIRELHDPNDYSAQLRIYDGEEEEPKGPQDRGVCVRVYGEDLKAVARLKFGIEKLVTGDCLVEDNNIPLWDNFFTTKASQTYIAEILEEIGAFIRVDSRYGRIHVSGRLESRRAAMQLCTRKILETRGQRQQIELSKSQLGMLFRGRFAELQADFGEENLTLDVSSRTLTIQGDREAVTMAKLAIERSGRHLLASGNEPDGGDCPVCFCELTSPVQLDCGHSYCLACIRQYLTSSVRFPIRCLGESGDNSSCDVPIPLSIVNRILEPNEESRFLYTAYLAYIRQHPKELHYCPTPDCQILYRPAGEGVVIQCPSCLIRICAHCHVEEHEGMTCRQYRDNISRGEDLFKKWKDTHDVKSCPECGAGIEKSSGCNHMVCANCRTHMCWVCLKKFPKDKVDGWNGVYAHMRNAHGGIGV